jgi:hypothetical protein
MCPVQHRFALQFGHPLFGAHRAIMGMADLAGRDVQCAYEVGARHDPNELPRLSRPAGA